MMETSSPLAAMQHAHNLHCSYQIEGPAAFVARLHSTSTFGPDSFNFRDLAMKRSTATGLDYFNMPKPLRGSSPTASLAADLSQNMHIDQSPDVPPTPRRALFSNNFFAIRDKCFATTPPVASSPGIVDGMDMDMSPLPHKPPFSSVEVQLQSPTPEETPVDSSLLSPPPSDPISTDLLLPSAVDKRKPVPRRPSLTRTKGLSTGCIPQAPHQESQLPPFTFGNYQASKSAIGLEQIWESSPPQKPSSPITSMPRSRQPFLHIRNAGSPLALHTRKASTSNPLVRPRKLTRRSLSMYECPEDVMKQERDSEPALPPIVDLDSQQQTPQLPHFLTDQAGDLPRISKNTMIDVLDGRYDHMYEKRVIIDCRFEYEYHGGHIDGAVNFNDKDKLASQLLDVEPTSNALLIFHCEYSAHRAPLTAKFVRNRDRTVNADRYPALTYPEVYILDGGYSSFFKDHQSRCYPQNYVEMDAKEHELACERELGKVKQRSKLLRAQTFAFGQRSPGLDSSPTAMGRSRMDSDDMDMGLDFTPMPVGRPTFDSMRRGGNLRQFSY